MLDTTLSSIQDPLHWFHSDYTNLAFLTAALHCFAQILIPCLFVSSTVVVPHPIKIDMYNEKNMECKFQEKKIEFEKY